ncbi:hypothetical protein ABU614_18350 [Lysobacter firmicutimachus]|uniref:Uncharacterized protein n=1 Tax=Lysobacter firmicutimachus TaxID=1792846 RepID=A0AAU8MQL6_9GAMM
MGIYANILIRRVAADRVDDAWLDAISAGLCRAIGTDRFVWIENRADPDLHALLVAWHARLAAHPLAEAYCLCDPDLYEPGLCHEADRRKHELWALMQDDLDPRPLQGQRVVQRSMNLSREPGDPPPGSRYEQDGPPIDADPGECLLQIRLSGSYYYEDYPCGDPVLHAAVADWLDAHIPGCEVWYGGDASGVLAVPFGPDRRRQLIEHARARGDLNRYWQPPSRAD